MKYIIIIIFMITFSSCNDYNQVQEITYMSKTELININTSSRDELMTISGIGIIKADEIIDNRPYTSIYEIKTKTKVGDKIFYNIKEEVKL